MTVVVPPISGTTLSSSEVEFLRSGEVVKKYYVGAYVDPSRPQIRHDPHVVERIEQTSRWNLRPNVPVVASGPTYKAVEENALKNAMQQQYDIEAHKQRQANEEVQNQTSSLKQEMAELKTKMLAQSESDVKRLEEKVEMLSAKLASLGTATSSKATQPQVQEPLGSSLNHAVQKATPPSSQQGVQPWEASVQEE